MSTPDVAAVATQIFAAIILLMGTVLLLWCYRRLIADATPGMAAVLLRADDAYGVRSPGPYGRGRREVPHRRLT